MKKLAVGSLVFALISCLESAVVKEDRSTCYKWSIEADPSGFQLYDHGNLVFQDSIRQLSYDKLFKYDLNDVLVFVLRSHIVKVDCKNNVIQKFRLKSRHIYDPTVQLLGDGILYHDLNQFYLIDSNMDSLYSSWEFLRELPDSITLGLSGANISYYHLFNDKIVVRYDLLTDVDPVFVGVMTDTILLDHAFRSSPQALE